MISKLKEKEEAVRLRKEGRSYSEILKRIPVAKSTLSLWLRSVGLSKRQEQRLTKKKLEASRRGAAIRRKQRIETTKEIFRKAEKDVQRITKRELWLIGVALYWAEGAKEKPYAVSGMVRFGNSDPDMITLFLKWLKEICLIPPDEFIYELYIHKTADWVVAREYWSRILFVSPEDIRVYFKRPNINTKRKNIGETYRGLLRVKVNRSVNLNRKIAGWVWGINKFYK